MEHEMSLTGQAFDRIRSGAKVIEIRLYDEKRRKVGVGDTIVFSKLPEKTEKLRVSVAGLSIFGSFRELLSAFDGPKFGHGKGIGIEDRIQLQREHYTEEEERKYGVVGIHIKLIA